MTGSPLAQIIHSRLALLGEAATSVASALPAATGASANSSPAAAVRYQFAQPQSFSDWWETPLLVLVCLALAVFVIYMYRRDSVELRPGVGVFLAVLRLTAFCGLLLFYLDLQKWSEQKEIQNSRVLVLADTSISMSLSNTDATSSNPADSRIGQVISEFSTGDMLDTLRKTHDVQVWRFDRDLGRVVGLPRIVDTTGQREAELAALAAREIRGAWLRYVILGAAGVLALVIVSFIGSRLIGQRGGGWLFGVAATLSAVTLFGALAYLNLDNPRVDLLVLMGVREPSVESTADKKPDDAKPADSERADPKSGDKKGADAKPGELKILDPKKFDWATALKPRGVETRLGESLRDLINNERAQPLSAVIVFTDGGQNAGLDPSAAVQVARDASVPVYLVGLGSDRRPVSARIADFAVPPRAYPGDAFTVTADIEAQGMAGRQVQVELVSRPAGKQKSGEATNWNSEATESVILPGNGKKERVKFELAGIKEAGRRTLQLRLKMPAGIKNLQQQPSDLARDSDLEIVDRKNRVLLLAGGPTREYQFLRNQLRRDRDTVVDVLLQTANGPISQEANKILDNFPTSMQELAEYDAIVAFDPDWQRLDADPAANDRAIALLEKWVAEEAGGLVLIAGPVYTDSWVSDSKMAKIRTLYPVEFSRLLIRAHDAKYNGEKPGTIQFTPDGQQAEFLWLDTSGAGSEHAWAEFNGVYGYYAVKGKKPGATVYARFSDPITGASGDELPIYFAGQLYGAGRVFYLGSGEMWRLRAMGEQYFEQFYTKVLRHVSQGRMLRGSRRGSLAVDRDSYLLGSTIEIDARLTNIQHDPLEAAKVIAQITPQEGAPTTTALLADSNRKGTFHGQFVALQPGAYRIEVAIPDSTEDPLLRQVMVKVPDLEKDNPQRNDPLLSGIATDTGGKYYVGVKAALGQDGQPALAPQLKDQSRQTLKTGDIDKPWQKLWVTYLLCGICGLLCIEWLTRRLSRLA